MRFSFFGELKIQCFDGSYYLREDTSATSPVASQAARRRQRARRRRTMYFSPRRIVRPSQHEAMPGELRSFGKGLQDDQVPCRKRCDLRGAMGKSKDR
jgi:hypothetical protein